MIEFRNFITRELLRAERDNLFVFGDNMERTGLGGQAREMRGEPNAVGLVTKRSPSNAEVAFLSNSDLPDVLFCVASDVTRLHKHLEEGGTVIWPRAGIGTGLASLREKAPAIADYYDKLLLQFLSYQNTGPL